MPNKYKICFERLCTVKGNELKFYNKQKKVIFKVIPDTMLIGFPALVKSEKNDITHWASPAIVRLLNDNDKKNRNLVIRALHTIELTGSIKSEDEVIEQTLTSITEHKLM